MGKCIVCGKKFKSGQRADTLYDSPKCRSVAYRQRKKAERQLKAANLDMFQQQDLKALSERSAVAAEFVKRVASLFGKEIAEESLDAFWDLAYQCGCNLAERFAHE